MFINKYEIYIFISFKGFLGFVYEKINTFDSTENVYLCGVRQ